MPLERGTMLGSYEILALVGAGGMGEVYRARDPRLGREVAIKVLPSSFSSDEGRLSRFQQEARAAGRLNHPNVLAIYDIGTHQGSPFLVSELLLGETLRDRLDAGHLPRTKVFELAGQVAMGLAAAHDEGIIHRDLKPENLFLTKDGRVKILDFGLAKLTLPEKESRSEMPTLRRNTEPGAVMGTVGYMSPEQVRGQDADARSDVFALGSIVYEMLTGKRAFQRPTPIETMNAILSEEPPVVTDTSPGLARLLSRCLEKRPDERFQSARDFGFALEALSGSSGESIIPKAPENMVFHGLTGWILAGVLSVALLTLGIAHLREALPEVPMVRFSVSPPEGASLEAQDTFALSPDGRQLVFTAVASGVPRLFLRPLDTPQARLLPGTDDASFPFWSPDSRFVGFFASGKLKKIDVGGGPPRILCDAAQNRGGTWNHDGVILFAPDFNGPLYRVSADGGNLSPATTLDASRQEYNHHWPQFINDGKHFLYFARSADPDQTGIFVRSLDTDADENRQLVHNIYSSAVYSPPYLLYVRGETLMAQPFDPTRLALSGEPRPLFDEVESFLERPLVSISQTGVLAFRSPDFGATLPTWFDREGEQIEVLDTFGKRFGLNLSPDERWLASGRSGQQRENPDLWLFDLSLGTSSRLTSHPAHDILPVWSPDNSRLVFSSTRLGGGGNDLFVLETRGDGEDVELLLRTGATNIATDWSTDGRFILYQASDPETVFDLWALPLEGEREPILLVRTEFSEEAGRLSPDGRWLAYTSNESGRYEVYVRPFMQPGRRQAVSTDGGLQPLWRSDGNELFYLSPERSVMSAALDSRESTINVSAPRKLFEASVYPGAPYNRSYAVSRDGQRFLVETVINSENPGSIQIVSNWTPEKTQ